MVLVAFEIDLRSKELWNAESVPEQLKVWCGWSTHVKRGKEEG